MSDYRQREQGVTIKVEAADVADAAVGQTIGRYKLLEKVSDKATGRA